MQGPQVQSLIGELRSHMLQLSPCTLTTEPAQYRPHAAQLDKPTCISEDPEQSK